MDMASRVAVISLMNSIDQLPDAGNPQTISAYDELKLLKDTLGRFDGSSADRSVINAFDDQITEAVGNLKDALHHSVPEVGSVLETIKNLREDFIRESTMIGILDQFKEIRGELLRGDLELKTMSLFGMAGIGKTHLARKIFHLPIINETFHLRVWVTLGPNAQTEKILKDIAAQLQLQLGNQYVKNDKISLREQIHKNLYGRRYFIVLDDIWSCQAWIDLKMWFPSEKRGSRLLLTTRLEEVANYPNNPSLHEMRFLNLEESWNLLCRDVFSEEMSPPQMEEAGRKIAEQCEGLPLLILEVARLLSQGETDPDPQYWTEVANKKNGVFTDAYECISEVLLSSYEYLPQYLQECFLYMAAFPQNYEIPLSKLISLWLVEDFIEPPNQSQDFAVECLKMLISQSLVIVKRHSSNDTIKSAKLHSTYWHLCVIKARKSKFLHVLDCMNDGFDDCIGSQRRLSIQNNVLFGIKDVYDSMAAAFTGSSLLCTGQDHQFPVPICSDMMSLEVLDAYAIRFYEFPVEVLKLLRLKYLALTHNGNLPCFISKLQNLRSLIVRQHRSIKVIKGGDSACLPKEIWDLQELRHLRIMGSNLPDPTNDAQLPNLLTLHVKGQSCTENVFRSIPKLKKLGIKIELQPRSTEILNCFDHISILQELESLKCVVVNPRLRSQVVSPPDPVSGFPKTLQKLSLNGLGYSWKHMNVIGSLPKLRVLKLRCSAFRGPEWETKAEEFQMLEYLLLEDIDLSHWTTEDDECFPNLHQLIIRHCYNLMEIPPKIGEISTLQRMEVFDCNPLVVASANKIKMDEEENGNSSLKVPVSSSWEF